MGNNNMINRLRLETDCDDISKLSTEKQKTRTRDVFQRQMEKDKKVKALEAEYKASSRKKNQQNASSLIDNTKRSKRRLLEPQYAAIFASLFHARLETTQGAYKSTN